MPISHICGLPLPLIAANANLLPSQSVQGSKAVEKSAVSTFTSGVQIFIPLGGVIDFEEELKRLTKERAKLEKELSLVERKLADETFLARASQEVVDREQGRYLVFKEKLDKTLYWQERVQGLIKSNPG